MTDAKHLSSVTRDETPAAPVREDDWLDDLAVADLPEPLQEWAEIVGVRGAVRLAESVGGEYRYIPKVDKLLIRMRDTRIRREFTGGNLRPLARKYKLSETWIREIIEAKVDDRQASLFPDADPAPILPP